MKYEETLLTKNTYFSYLNLDLKIVQNFNPAGFKTVS